MYFIFFRWRERRVERRRERDVILLVHERREAWEEKVRADVSYLP